MTKRLKIVVSTPTFLPIVGGAELAIHEIYRRLASRHDVTVLTVQPRRRAVAMYGANDYLSRPYEVREALGQAEARAPDIVGRVLNHTSVPYIVELGRLRRERPIDVLNFHYLKPHGGALLCARYVWGIPVVASLVGRTDVVWLLPHRRRPYSSFVASRAEIALPISKFYLRGGCLNRRVRVIPFGADTAEFSPTRRSEAMRRDLGVRPEDLMMAAVQ
ncbi:MAG: glycosyltransferase, partial [Solirubrobacteraceae bacterium]